MRALALAFALCALATTARAEAVHAQVVLDGDGVVLQVAAASWTIAEPALRASLVPLAGRTITLEVPARPAAGKPLVGARVTEPARVEARGHREGGALVLDDDRREGRARLALSGPGAALVAEGRDVVVDAWRLEGGLVVLAVEGRTTGQWTLIHLLRRSDWWPTPTAVIHGQRAVWVLERAGTNLRIKRGGDTGWVITTEVEVGEPRAAPSSPPTDGLDDRLPR